MSVLRSAQPTDFPVPLLVCQHVSPDLPDHLAERLSRPIALHVKTAAGGATIAQDAASSLPFLSHCAVETGPQATCCR